MDGLLATVEQETALVRGGRISDAVNFRRLKPNWPAATSPKRSG